jgi:CspA family cold shock protein
MHRGRVLWYCDNLGYGFLSIEHEGEKIFVDRTALAESGLASLKEGEAVSYEVVRDEQGRRAKNVSVQ